MHKRAEQIIDYYDFKKHAEGGWFRRTYESEVYFNDGKHRTMTAIMYLLEGDSFSAFHRITSDEIWCFHEGSSLEIITINKHGKLEVQRLGRALLAGHLPQICVKAGTWFAAVPTEKTAYTLVSCAVSPGFSFANFELGKQDVLVQKFPQHKEIISRWTI